MSMICSVLGLSPAQIEALRAAPSLASDLAPRSEGEPPASVDVGRRLAALGPFEQTLDLEKSWHILHYLFTGHIDDSISPGDALLTGEPLGDDVGYGPPRLHGEKETLDFNRFLETVDLEILENRVNFHEMQRFGVYSIPSGPEPEAEYEQDLRRAVHSYFPPLRDYVRTMVEKNDGLLIWLS